MSISSYSHVYSSTPPSTSSFSYSQVRSRSANETGSLKYPRHLPALSAFLDPKGRTLNPVKLYTGWLSRRTGPRAPTHYLETSIKIAKGNKTGRLIVPCPVIPVTHTYDFNPSLLKRTKVERPVSGIKTTSGEALVTIQEKVQRTKLPRNVPILYHPDEGESIELEKNEEFVKKEDVERCPHCGQKAVVATVGEQTGNRGVHFNRDPVFEVTLSDPATEDLEIPVKFGLWPKTVRSMFYISLMIDALFIGAPVLLTLQTYFAIGLTPPVGTTAAQIAALAQTKLVNYIMAGVLFVTGLFVVPVYHKASWEGWKWLKQMAPYIKPIPKEERRI